MTTTAIDFYALASDLASMTARTDAATAELETLLTEDSEPAFDWLNPVCDGCILIIAITYLALKVTFFGFGIASAAAIRLGHIARAAWDTHRCTDRLLDELAYGLLFTAGWSMIVGQVAIAMAKDFPQFIDHTLDLAFCTGYLDA